MDTLECIKCHVKIKVQAAQVKVKVQDLKWENKSRGAVDETLCVTAAAKLHTYKKSMARYLFKCHKVSETRVIRTVTGRNTGLNIQV